jgi:tetratricopeptide (TPR) repeat protein
MAAPSKTKAAPPQAPAPPPAGKPLKWRAPEWATLVPAFAPAALATILFGLVVLVLFGAPRFLAQPPDSFRAAPSPTFVWTPVEAQRLRASALFHNGALAEDLEPWDEAPARGIGSTGYDTAKQNLFEQGVAKLRDAATALEPGALSQVLGALGQGNQAAVLYHGALALYRGGDFAQAEDRATKALDKAKAGAPAKDDAAALRLDGEQAATAYLLGHIRLKRGELDGAVRAFDEALKAARTSRGYPAYRTVADPLFSLDPRYSLTDLSIADIWNDELVALNRQDPSKALRAAQDLFAMPAAVAAHPRLAATVQMIAAEAGEPDRVAAVNPDWSAFPGDERLAQARRISAAAMLVMGDAGLMSDLEGSPERDLFAPWVQLARERQLVKSEVGLTPDAAGGVGTGVSGEQGVFLRRWRSEYLGVLGADFLTRAHQEHQRGYYALLLRSQVFPGPVAFSAAARWWGLAPWQALVLLGILALIPIGFAVGGWVYWETFSALHFADRLRKLRRAAGDPLAQARAPVDEAGA